MRLGVLDVGSNTVHLLVVDAYRGAHPWPAASEKSVLRLSEQIGKDGELSKAGARGLVDAVTTARQSARKHDVDDFLAFATSAVRDAANSADVLARVRKVTGVDLAVLTGEEEARLTFLAVRRWFGWSAGRLLDLDIGGGSLEIAGGVDEDPDVAMSLPLGAGRLTRQFFNGMRTDVPPDAAALQELTSHVEAALDPIAAKLADTGWDQTTATSKTFRTLARLAGAAPSTSGVYEPRRLTAPGLRQVLAFLRHIPLDALAGLEGVSASRAHQLLAGAVVAEATMRRLDVPDVHICPWALREGVILRRLDAS